MSAFIFLNNSLGHYQSYLEICFLNLIPKLKFYFLKKKIIGELISVAQISKQIQYV